MMVRISDEKLLEILRENARLPYVKIAEKLGVSEAAVRKRIKKLEKEGIIRKYTIEVDPRKIGYQIVALIGIDTKPEHYIKALEEIKKMPEIVNLWTSSGDHMILAECWLKNSQQLTEFVGRLEKVEGTTRICPAVILEKVK